MIRLPLTHVNTAILQTLGVTQDDIHQIDLREMSENFEQAFIKNPELLVNLS